MRSLENSWPGGTHALVPEPHGGRAEVVVAGRHELVGVVRGRAAGERDVAAQAGDVEQQVGDDRRRVVDDAEVDHPSITLAACRAGA